MVQKHYSLSYASLLTSKLWCQTIRGSADFFCHETWKTWNHGCEFSVWLYSQLKNTTFHFYFESSCNLNKRNLYRLFLVIPDTISNENTCYYDVIDTWGAGYCHTDPLFWRCFFGRFHHNGVLSQWRFSLAVHRRCIFRSVLLGFRGRIEIDHLYGLSYRGFVPSQQHSTTGAGRRGRATGRHTQYMEIHGKMA